jgi:hypothetical protein
LKSNRVEEVLGRGYRSTMQKAGSITYWFCVAVALFLVLFGLWNILLEHHGRVMPLFCLGIAATFYVAGYWIRWTARRVPRDA